MLTNQNDFGEGVNMVVSSKKRQTFPKSKRVEAEAERLKKESREKKPLKKAPMLAQLGELPSAPVDGLNREIIDNFARYAKEGVPFDAICDFLGVSYTAFWKWFRSGSLYIEGNGQPLHHKLYGQFVLALRKASAVYRIESIKNMHTRKDWFRFLYIMERRDPKTFGRQNALNQQSSETYDPDERFD
jgi:hypothetical protein